MFIKSTFTAGAGILSALSSGSILPILKTLELEWLLISNFQSRSDSLRSFIDLFRTLWRPSAAMSITKVSAETSTVAGEIILTKFTLLRIRDIIFGRAVLCNRLSPRFAALNATARSAAFVVIIGTTAPFVFHVARDPGPWWCPPHVQHWVVLATQAQFLNIVLRRREWWHSVSRVMLPTSPIYGNSNKCDTFYTLWNYTVLFTNCHIYISGQLQHVTYVPLPINIIIIFGGAADVNFDSDTRFPILISHVLSYFKIAWPLKCLDTHFSCMTRENSGLFTYECICKVISLGFLATR